MTKYSGRYRVRGHSLRRESDGLLLLIVERRSSSDPAKGTSYILDKSYPSGRYVSALWETSEFATKSEHEPGGRSVRYRITWFGDYAEIKPIRDRHRPRPPVASARPSRGPSGVTGGVEDVS